MFFSFWSKNTRILCTMEGHFVQTSVTFSSVYRYLFVLIVVVVDVASWNCLIQKHIHLAAPKKKKKGAGEEVARDGNPVFTLKYLPC